MDISHWLDVGRDDFNLEIIGCGIAAPFPLQLSTLLFVKMFKLCDRNFPLLDPALKFNKSITKQETILSKLAKLLCTPQGGSATTIHLRMLSYHNKLSKRADHRYSVIKDSLLKESGLIGVGNDEVDGVGGGALTSFADVIDIHYNDQMTSKITDISEARACLISCPRRSHHQIL